MIFDTNNLPDLKIRVANSEESARAQQAICRIYPMSIFLGCDHPPNYPYWLACDKKKTGWACGEYFEAKTGKYQEIHLLQLEALAALHTKYKVPVIERVAESLNCPFCGDHDFDKIGLKYHLTNYCKEYEGIDTSEC